MPRGDWLAFEFNPYIIVIVHSFMPPSFFPFIALKYNPYIIHRFTIHSRMDFPFLSAVLHFPISFLFFCLYLVYYSFNFYRISLFLRFSNILCHSAGLHWLWYSTFWVLQQPWSSEDLGVCWEGFRKHMKAPEDLRWGWEGRSVGRSVGHACVKKKKKPIYFTKRVQSIHQDASLASKALSYMSPSKCCTI